MPLRSRCHWGRCRRRGAADGLVVAGVDHIDTVQYYGPGVVNDLIHEAPYHYPDGLAIVSKVVHDHNGSVSVEQTGETGTVFLVKFPRSQTGIGDSLEAEVNEPNSSPA